MRWMLGWPDWVHRIESKYERWSTDDDNHSAPSQQRARDSTTKHGSARYHPWILACLATGLGTSLLVFPDWSVGLPTPFPGAASLPVCLSVTGWGTVQRGWGSQSPSARESLRIQLLLAPSLTPLGRPDPRINSRSTRAIFPGLHCGSAASSQSTRVCCVRLLFNTYAQPQQTGAAWVAVV